MRIGRARGSRFPFDATMGSLGEAMVGRHGRSDAQAGKPGGDSTSRASTCRASHLYRGPPGLSMASCRLGPRLPAHKGWRLLDKFLVMGL